MTQNWDEFVFGPLFAMFSALAWLWLRSSANNNSPIRHGEPEEQRGVAAPVVMVANHLRSPVSRWRRAS